MCLLQVTDDRKTPLAYAAQEGHERAVSYLLAKGATDAPAWANGYGGGSLWKAVENGHEGVVRRLVDAGLGVVGGDSMCVLGAMVRASTGRRPRILRLLLRVEGERRSRYWARQFAGNLSILHHACMQGCIPTVHVALEAGGDENLRNDVGMCPADIVGVYPLQGNQTPEEVKAAIRRMLKRGPAFRTRSWAWPRRAGAGRGGGASAPAGSRPGEKAKAPLGVRVFRAKDGGRLYATRFAR